MPDALGTVSTRLVYFFFRVCWFQRATEPPYEYAVHRFGRIAWEFSNIRFYYTQLIFIIISTSLNYLRLQWELIVQQCDSVSLKIVAYSTACARRLPIYSLLRRLLSSRQYRLPINIITFRILRVLCILLPPQVISEVLPDLVTKRASHFCSTLRKLFLIR